jgi:hypothetical protein
MILERIGDIIVEEKPHIFDTTRLEITILDYEKNRFLTAKLFRDDVAKLLRVLKEYLRGLYSKDIEYYKKRLSEESDEKKKEQIQQTLFELAIKMKEVE